jgi:hypothetical protein
MNFPAAAQHRNDMMLPKPNTKLPRDKDLFDLKPKKESPTPKSAKIMKIPDPTLELTLHSLNSLNSSPRINPKVIGSVLFEVK